MKDDFWIERQVPYIQNAIDKLRPKADGYHCITCGKELVGRQKTFCSIHCHTINFEKYNWVEIQKRIKNRDGNKCKWNGCKETENLSVHHIKKVKDFPELVMEDSNLITFCREHHEVAEKRTLLKGQLRLCDVKEKEESVVSQK